MSSTESMATPALPTSPIDARVVPVVAAVGGEVEGDATPCPPPAVPRGRRRRLFAVEKPAYRRMVHGRTAYMVGCGPRR